MPLPVAQCRGALLAARFPLLKLLLFSEWCRGAGSPTVQQGGSLVEGGGQALTDISPLAARGPAPTVGTREAACEQRPRVCLQLKLT